MKTKLKFWLMPNAGFESRQVIEQEIAHFHRLHPAIEIVPEVLSWSRAWFRLITAIKEKSGPDVIQAGTTWIATLAYLGAIKRLEHRDIAPGRFHHSQFSQCQFFGHLWALPWFCEGRALFYRKDILRAAGCTPDDLKDWEGLKRCCAALKTIGAKGPAVAPLGFSSQKEQGLIQDLSSWIWSYGGDFLAPSDRRPWLENEHSRQGIADFIDLIAAKHISKVSLEQNSGEVVEGFFQDNAYAFLLASSWPLQVYLNPASKRYVGARVAAHFDVAPIPGGPFGRFNFAGGSALAISATSHHANEAFKFIEYLTGTESQQRYCTNINMLPARGSATVHLTASPSIQQSFEKAIAVYGRSFPAHPLWGSIEQIIVSGFAQSLRDFMKSGNDRELFYRNIAEINNEIQYILTIFGE